MKLISFGVSKYRSIINTRKLPISNMTILIGPNNEGKSNLLHAIVSVLVIVSKLQEIRLFAGRLRSLPYILRDAYEWERDFPVSLQEKYPDGESVFSLEFELDSKEIVDFKKKTGSNLNGTLPIQITIGKKEPGFKVLKKGPGGTSLTNKAEQIARFIGERFEFEYIPTVRTARVAEEIIDEMVKRELRPVEKQPAFRDALKEISKLQRPVLENISKNIAGTLKEFVPSIRSVKVQIPEDDLYRAFRSSCVVIVDDGTPTNLKRKGDGVQSLVALGLMRHSSVQGGTVRSSVLAIEEPESHLHPNAVHQLKAVLAELGKRQQVILTTHNPLFVNRVDIRSNVLVTENKARPAESAQQIRQILGVKASDNLLNAEVVLLVEGEDDRKAMRAILASKSSPLQGALGSGVLAIDSTLGPTNLAYKLGHIRDSLCLAHSFVDHDAAGKTGVKKAEQEKLLTMADVHYATCPGLQESELEDLYETQLYEGLLQSKHGVTLQTPKFKNSKKKWSQRMKDSFLQQGKSWDDFLESQLEEIANLVVASPNVALNSVKSVVINHLVTALENKVKSVGTKVA